MRRQMTFAQYRAMDIFVFTALECLCETMIVLGSTIWFADQLYTLSLTAAVTAIVLVRWGAPAAVPAVCGGFVFCLFSGATPSQYLIYCAGNLLALALVPLVRGEGWKKLQGNVLLALLYGLTAALLRKAFAKAGIVPQTYYNRADMPGGSTLGCIALSHVSVPSVDIGLPQLAMHSAYETCAVSDALGLEEAMAAYYGSSLEISQNGAVILK